MTSTITPELERRLTMAVERMPAFPQSVQTVLNMTRDLDTKAKDLVAVIEKDPVMTMKILRVINSAFYALPSKVTSVGQASVYLGFNSIKNMALSFAAIGVLPRFSSSSFDIQNYLLHSLSVAGVARALAETYAEGEADPTDCYMAGLLHDFGKVVFAQFLKPEFSRALSNAVEHEDPLHKAERYVIGADHAYVGGLLAKRWRLAEPLVSCIRDHHNPDTEPTAMMDCLRMADIICRMRQYGDAGNPWQERELKNIPPRFGEDALVAADGLKSLGKVIEEARLFSQVRSSGKTEAGASRDKSETTNKPEAARFGRGGSSSRVRHR